MMKKALAAILTLAMLFSLAACSSGNGSADEGEGATEPRNDLTVILSSEFTTLDPQKLSANASINFCSNIFDGLVALDEESNVVPMLATDWEISPDGLDYTFHLREGVKFHNGNDLTAEDVKLSVERFRDNEWMAFASFAVDSCDIVDDYTVTIHLKFPYGNFLSMLWYCYIIDSDHYNSLSEEDFARNPVGTGAYQFVEWAPAQYVTLKANPDYWNGAPHIENLRFNFVSDSNTAMMALNTGEADLSFGVTPLNYKQAVEGGKLATDSTTGNNFYYINFNCDRISKEVRQAISYAIDRETFNVVINEDTGYLSDIALTEGQEGYTTDLTTYPYDPDKAMELLEQAGATDLSLTFYYDESSANTKMAQTLQSQLGTVGIELILEPVESGTWWSTFGNGDYDLSRSGYPMEAANTDSCYYDMFHSTGSFNVSRINNPELDALLDEARRELDPEKRNEIYIQVNQIMAEEAYYIPLYFSASLLVYNPDLQGVHALTSQNYQYKDMHW